MSADSNNFPSKSLSVPLRVKALDLLDVLCELISEHETIFTMVHFASTVYTTIVFCVYDVGLLSITLTLGRTVTFTGRSNVFWLSTPVTCCGQV